MHSAFVSFPRALFFFLAAGSAAASKGHGQGEESGFRVSGWRRVEKGATSTPGLERGGGP